MNTGYADYFTITQRDVDFAWIYYAWTGVDAEVRGEATNVIWLRDYFQCVPDYYTPVIIASEATIGGRPDVVAALLKALSRGYTYAAEQPEAAAEVLLAAVPELDKDLVKESQRWVSDYYIAEAERWGQQKEEVWRDYVAWLTDNGVLSTPVDPRETFTNDFLP